MSPVGAGAAAALGGAALPPRLGGSATLSSSSSSWSWQRLRRSQQACSRPGRQLGAAVHARDGKKRRKSKASGSSAAPGTTSQEEAGGFVAAKPPRRVDPNINVPVSRQIVWAKAIKEYERQQAPGWRKPTPVAQAFRQDSLDEEEHRRRREEEERLAEEARRRKSDIVTLRSMFNTNISAAGEQPTGVTLVDGYNMLHMMKREDARVADLMLAADADPSGGHLEAARQLLLSQLDVYSAQEGMYVHVVLDAMGRGFCSEHNKLGMLVTFTSKMEADSMIMVKAQEYVDRGVDKVCIVTDDRELAELGAGDIQYKRSGQAVFASSCRALAKLIEQSETKLVERLGMLAVSKARHPLARVSQHKERSRGSGQRNMMLSLRNNLAQQEREREALARKQQREQRRQQP